MSYRTDRRTASPKTEVIPATSGQIRERTDCLSGQSLKPTDEAIKKQATSDSLRVSRRRLIALKADLRTADIDALRLFREHHFLTSRHVADLVHSDAATELAGYRAAQRQLKKLCSLRLVDHLPRKVGGYGGGQAQTVWHLTEAGHRLLDLNRSARETANEESPVRRRFREPSMQFLAHTLRVADIRLVLERLSKGSNAKELTTVQTEPRCWRTWVGAYGTPVTLKPDLYAELADADFDYFYFIEADMGSEHMPTIIRKARVYQTYYQTGREQARHDGVFPLVLWVTPDARRAEQILAAIRADPKCDERLHRTLSMADLRSWLEGHEPP